MHNYKCLGLAVMICATLVNTQADRHTDSVCPVILVAQPSEQLIDEQDGTFRLILTDSKRCQVHSLFLVSLSLQPRSERLCGDVG